MWLDQIAAVLQKQQLRWEEVGYPSWGSFDYPLHESLTVDEWEFHGCFAKPCTVTTPENVNLFWINNKGIGVVYNFIGRTGEKTFDIFKKGVNKETTIYHFYFTLNELLPLQNTAGMLSKRGCKDKDDILLKLIDLKGNQLTYQIILPDCMKSK